MKRSDLDTGQMLRLISEMSAEHPAVSSLKFVEDWLSGEIWPSPDVPARMPFAPRKVVLAKLEQLVRLNLIEYGTVITRPWLTGAGQARLAASRASGSRPSSAPASPAPC